MIDLSQLNEQQREAVTTIDGPVIAIAGAGSGKTRCLTYRIAYMLDKKIKPNNIVAITFTNKAAGEIKSRVIELIGEGSRTIWIGTFHSICLRILKVYSNRLGFDTFSIYDSKDSDKILKGIIKKMEKDGNIIEVELKDVACYISKQKSDIVYPNQAMVDALDDDQLKLFANIYKEYQSQLKFNNAMDFNDLILNTYTLMSTDIEVRGLYQNKFKYIMVDESQDTDSLQFKLVELFAGAEKNIFLVGDDWQGIYSFRNANLNNFLQFTSKYPLAKVVKIETNYRSTQHIVNAANAVVRNNEKRLDKTCVSNNDAGRKINFFHLDDEYAEANKIVAIIKEAVERGCKPEEIAILYRTNFQARAIEQELVRSGVIYNIISNISFFERKEIKDIISYVKFILNPYDAAAFARIVNVPKRGIGEASVDKIVNSAYVNDISILEQLRDLTGIKGIPKKAKPEIADFAELIEISRMTMITEEAIMQSAKNLVDIFEKSGYQHMLLEDEDGEDRLANVEEFISMAARAEEDGINMEDFITSIALYSDQDSLSDSKVNLMTVHGSKGLEYDVVIIAGANKGLFPHFRSQLKADLEEERRLFYVAMTRARKELDIVAVRRRMTKGQSKAQEISQFVGEIPKEDITMNISGKRTHNDDFDFCD